MSEGYPELRNFWDDFNEAYYTWALNMVMPHSVSDNATYLIQVYCSMHFHAQNCTQCDDLCEIQNLEPCRKIWTDLSEECCQTCDLFVASCEVDKCIIRSPTSSNDDKLTTQLLTTTYPQNFNSSNVSVPLSLPINTNVLSNGNNANFRDSKSFYVLVTLLPICGFIGRGSY